MHDVDTSPAMSPIHRVIAMDATESSRLLSMPGAKGILALLLTAVVGHAFAVAALQGKSYHPLFKVSVNAIALCVMAGFFWCWAAYKLLSSGDPDMGVVSFLVAFVAAYRTAELARPSSRSRGLKPIQRMQTLLPAACFCPMINYLAVLALKPTLPLSFQCYLVRVLVSILQALAHSCHPLLALLARSSRGRRGSLPQILGAFTWSLAAIRGGWLLGDEAVVSSLRDEARGLRRG